MRFRRHPKDRDTQVEARAAVIASQEARQRNADNWPKVREQSGVLNDELERNHLAARIHEAMYPRRTT